MPTNKIEIIENPSAVLDLAAEDYFFDKFVEMVFEAGAIQYLENPPSKEWTEAEIRRDIRKYWNERPSDREDLFLHEGKEYPLLSYYCIKEIARKGGGKDDKLLRKEYDIKRVTKKKGLWNAVKNHVRSAGKFLKNNIGTIAAIGVSVGTLGIGSGSALAIAKGASLLGDVKDKANDKKNDYLEKAQSAQKQFQNQVNSTNDAVTASYKDLNPGINVASTSRPQMAIAPPPPQIGQRSAAPTISNSPINSAGDAAALTVGVSGCAASFGVTMLIPLIWFSWRIYQSWGC